VGLFELFRISDECRALIYDHVTVAQLRQQARREGLRTLREDGLCKMLAGLTTIEEIAAATLGDAP
jgi:type II secretory ATPase GspE/PulE/Tfp pilus assembly ATPase PilB-like protein